VLPRGCVGVVSGGGAVKSPFPWFGGKSRVAGAVWAAFGDVPNYVEPFAGSLAVLLGRPHHPKTETVNDRDCYLANFWRAVQASPDDVAHWADWPVNEADIEARHHWLVAQHGFRERMMREPDYFDAKIAGWWVWGLCGWIGSGWCQAAASPLGQRGPGGPPEAAGTGDAGRGVHRQLPHLGNAGRGVHRKRRELATYFEQLAGRLRTVRVACGDWSRVLGDSVTWRHGTTGVFLDPPYDDGEIDYAAGGRGIAAHVATWCRENGQDKRLRIALCGYDGDHDLPGWRVHVWKAHGGFSSQRSGDPNGNPHRERVWFSPGCLNGALADPLFARLESIAGGVA
jgi:DNA adenine methylase